MACAASGIVGDVAVVHGVQRGDRVVEADRWVEQQHLVEADRPLLLVQLRDPGGVRAAQAVAGEIDGGDLDPVLHPLVGHAHGAVEVAGIVRHPAGNAGLGGVDDEVGMGRGREAQDVKAGLVEGLGEELVGVGVEAAAGAGDQEHQRCPLLLVDEAVGHPGVVVPEHVRHLAGGERPHPVDEDVAVALERHHLDPLGRRRAHHRVGQGIQGSAVWPCSPAGWRRSCRPASGKPISARSISVR